MSSVNFLEWDSHFFKRNIGRSRLICGSTVELQEIYDSINIQNLDLVYLYSKENLSSGINNFFSEQMMSYYPAICFEIDIEGELSFLSHNDSVHLYKGENHELYELAYLAGNKSRFSSDSRFSVQEFEALYRTWIDNSRNGIMGHEILVYKEEEDIIGFLTVKVNGTESAKIGLISTKKDHQGKGIGSKLMEKLFHLLKSKNITKVFVDTQLENNQAIKFYKNLGFRINKIDHLFHLWIE